MQNSATIPNVGEIKYFHEESVFRDSFSISYKGYNTKTRQEVVIRTFQNTTLMQITNSNQLLSEEISLLKKFSHNNITKLLSFYPSLNEFSLIYDGANQGSLENYLLKATYLPEAEAVKHLHDILLAYENIFKSGQLLKSIRLNSFVLNDNMIKFFDLNLFKNLEKSKGPNLKSDDHFFLSIAPEIFSKQQSTNCDIWSIGLVFYMMLFGELPWKADSIEGFFKAVYSQPLNLKNKYQTLTKKVESVILKMLEPDPKKRITYDKLLEDSLFTKYQDDLQKREKKLIEKVKKKPDSWQAASMMYNGDPLVSILNLSVSRSNSSKSSFKTVQEYKKMMVSSQRIQSEQKVEEEADLSKALDLSAPLIKKSSKIEKNDLMTSNSPESVSDRELEDFMMTSSMKKSTKPMSKESQILNQMTKEEFGGADNVKSTADKIIEEALVDNIDQEKLNEEFKKYNLHIQRLCEYLQIYSHAAASATKLFKTDLIIIQCFFLYKRLMKALTEIYGALAKGDNVFEFKYWKDYLNSFFFIRAADIIEANLEKVEDVFTKLYQDCQKKLRNAKIKTLGIDIFINDDFEGLEIHFYTFLSTYLYNFIPSIMQSADKVQYNLILKHQVEIVDALILNRMVDFKPEEGLLNIDEHKKIMKTENIKEVCDYLKVQLESLDMFKN